MSEVAIIVPGIMGSRLCLGEEDVWPGPVFSLWLPYDKMPQLTREDLVATDVIRSISISTQYASLIKDLGTCGYREDDAPPTLAVCPYDWRKDNRLSARVLADLIDSLVDAHHGNAKVSIVAHSMGGLISRYYLESGEFSARAGFKVIRRLITIGTPHRGSPLALTAALGMEKRLFLNKDQVQQLASDPRYPSLYQLLPPQGEPFAWDQDRAAEFRDLSIDDPDVAMALGLITANLDAARAFQSRLDVTRRPAFVRYFFFVGTRQTTLSQVLLRKVGAAYRPTKLEVEDSGDGTVPIWSGSLTGFQSCPVGGEHGTLYQNDGLRRTMAGLLGKAGVLAAVPSGVEVALRETVAHPDDLVHAALTFSAGASTVDGELRVERATLGPEGKLTGFASIGIQHPIRYAGLAAERLGLTFKAPAVTGAYRVSFYPAGESEPAGSDELFVQAPPPP